MSARPTDDRTLRSISARFGFTLSLALLLSACGAQRALSPQESLSAPEEYRLSSLDVNLYPSNKLVCDPWGDNTDPRSNAGLSAELYYLLPSQPKYSRVEDLIANGHKAHQNLFFNALNVPTRKFDTGFVNDLGTPVKDDDQNTLVENFALRFRSVLKLAPDQEPGLYELAVLSDDGAIVRLREDDGVYREYVNNDGDHATRMGCGTQLVQLDRDSERLMEVDYYQGPRNHISLILLMRKADASLSRDPFCGHASNDDWFDYSGPVSVPKPKYQALLAHGWQPLAPSNYTLPNEAVFNPCKEGEAPQTLTFRISEVSSESITVVWTTDIPATSQLAVTDKATGETIVTTADNVLRTQHQVTISGLKPATEYMLTAISISDSYGKDITPTMAVRTEP